MPNPFLNTGSTNPYDKPLDLSAKALGGHPPPQSDNSLAYDPITKSGTLSTNAFLKSILDHVPAIINRHMKNAIEAIGTKLGKHAGKIADLEKRLSELEDDFGKAKGIRSAVDDTVDDSRKLMGMAEVQK